MFRACTHAAMSPSGTPATLSLGLSSSWASAFPAGKFTLRLGGARACVWDFGEGLAACEHTVSINNDSSTVRKTDRTVYR